MGEAIIIRNNISLFNKILSISIALLLIFYAISTSFLLLKSYLNFNPNANQLSDLTTNWQTGTILNIAIASSCPANYEPAFPNHYWPGITTGCWCPGTNPSITYSTQGSCQPFCSSSCTKSQLSSGCSDVAGKDRQALNVWGSIDEEPVQICIKRSSETLLNMAQYNSGDCPSGYKQCGKSTGNSVFCTQEDVCPISYIEVLSYSRRPGGSGCTIGTNCFLLDDSNESPRVLKFSRMNDSGDAQPLVEIRLNEYQMCEVADDVAITPNRLQFPLLKRKGTVCEGENNEWDAMSTLTEERLFELNGLEDYITSLSKYTSSGMKGYYATNKDGTDYNWKIFSRPYISWDPSCQGQISDVLNTASNAGHIKTVQLILMIIGLVSAISLGIVQPFIELRSLIRKAKKFVPIPQVERVLKWRAFKRILPYIFLGIVLPFQIWCLVLLVTAKNLFGKVVNDGCTDNLNAEKAFKDFSDKVGSSLQGVTASAAITAGVLFIFFVLRTCQNRMEKKLNNQQELLARGETKEIPYIEMQHL